MSGHGNGKKLLPPLLFGPSYAPGLVGHVVYRSLCRISRRLSRICYAAVEAYERITSGHAPYTNKVFVQENQKII